MTKIVQSFASPLALADGGTGPFGLAGYVLVSNGSGSAPAWASTGTGGVTSLAATANQTTVSAPSGVVTIGTVQDIGVSSSPTFAGVTLVGGLTLTGATVTGAPTWSSSQAITLSTGAQPSVTSLGTLSSLTLGGPLSMSAQTATMRSVVLTGSVSGSSSWGVPAAGATGTWILPAVHAGPGSVLTDVAGDGVLTMQPPAASGVTSIAGTANQINASAATGAVTLTLSSTLALPGTIVLGGTLTSGANTLALAGGTITGSPVAALGATTPTSILGSPAATLGATSTTTLTPTSILGSPPATLGATTATTLASGQLALSGATSGVLTIKAGAITTTRDLSLPAARGTAGQVLMTDGGANEITSWVTIPGAPISGTVAITNSVASTLATLTAANNSATGAEILVTITATDGVDFGLYSTVLHVALCNKGGTYSMNSFDNGGAATYTNGGKTFTTTFTNGSVNTNHIQLTLVPSGWAPTVTAYVTALNCPTAVTVP